MSGAGGRDGIGVRAGDDAEDAELLRRGGDGYNGEAETVGGVGGPEGEVTVQQRIAVLERKISEVKELEKKVKELEEKLKKAKQTEGSKFELVNQKHMTPTVLKDGTAFRTWREEFERWAGLRIRGMNEVLKLIGGRKQWGSELQE